MNSTVRLVSYCAAASTSSTRSGPAHLICGRVPVELPIESTKSPHISASVAGNLRGIALTLATVIGTVHFARDSYADVRRPTVQLRSPYARAGNFRTRRKGPLARIIVLALAATPAFAIPLLASGGGQAGGFNYVTTGPCTWIQSYVSGSGSFVMSGVTHSYHGGCVGMSSPNPPAYQWGRPVNGIGVRPTLYRNGNLCTEVVWQLSPNYGQTTHAFTFQWGPGVIPCGGGATFNTRTFGKVIGTDGVYRPNGAGSPWVVSPNAGW